MCGRYTLTTPLDDLLEEFGLPPVAFPYSPRFNIAPAQEAPVLARGSGGVRMGLLRWGLIPSWAKEPSLGSRLINARAETVAGKPAFRDAFRSRRCLVPADGFFEWKEEEGGKRKGGKGRKAPWWIHRPSRKPFTMAGIWERWEPREGPPLHTFAILTTAASPGLLVLHPRMPVILPPPAREVWLDPATPLPELAGLLVPYREEVLEAFPVSTLVNSPRNDLPACIEPLPSSPGPGE